MKQAQVDRKQSPKALVDAALCLSKQQIFKVMFKLLRSMSLQREDIPDLEALIEQIDECITELEVMGDDQFDPHPQIKVVIKPGYDRQGKLTTYYFYLRRALPGQARDDKSCGAIPFKPDHLYQLTHRATGQVKLLRCDRIWVSAQWTWESLMEKPRCYLDMTWLDATTHQPPKGSVAIATERFEFPACLQDSFSPDIYELADLTSTPTPLPPAAQIATGKRIDLSRAQSIALSPNQFNLVTSQLQNWEALSRQSTAGWTLLKRPNQQLLIDAQHQQILMLQGQQIILIMPPTQLLDRLEQLVNQIKEQDTLPAQWHSAAKKLAARIRQARRHSGEQMILTLLDLESSS